MTAGVPFLRVTGAGNDFLALAEPAADPSAEDIRAWCTRGLSLGADGLFVLRRRAPADGGRPATVDMAYFNADGSVAELCLNGTRCAAQLAFHLGWAKNEVEVITGAGPVAGRWIDATAAATDLPRPRSVEAIEVEAAGRRIAGDLVAAGVPHFVVEWPDGLAAAPLAELGPPLRRHPRFPAGANVDLVTFVASHRVEVRSWERGVEGETLACGTGVLASVAAGLARGRLALPVTVLTAGGAELTVAATPADGDRWSLAGDARVLAEGRLLPGASRLPAPAAWNRRPAD